MITAFVHISADPATIAPLGRALAGIDGIAEVYSVTGDDDLLAIVRVNDHERVARIVTEHIGALDGVLATRTSIAFRQYDPTDVSF